MENGVNNSKEIISNDIINHIKRNFGNIIFIFKSNIALSNNVFFVVTVRKKIVLKIFTSQDESLFNLSDHYKLINYFSAKQITPKCLFFNKKYCILDFIEGTPLQINSLNNKNMDNFAKIIKEFHSCKIDINIRDFQETSYEYIKKIPKEYLENPSIKKAIKSTDELFIIINKFNKDNCLSHNDINVNNFIQTNKKIYILDFEYATINDRYSDLASLYCLLGKDKFSIFADRYRIIIDENKLQSYILLKDLISALWYFMMLGSSKYSEHDYLKEGIYCFENFTNKLDGFI